MLTRNTVELTPRLLSVGFHANCQVFFAEKPSSLSLLHHSMIRTIGRQSDTEQDELAGTLTPASMFTIGITSSSQLMSSVDDHFSLQSE